MRRFSALLIVAMVVVLVASACTDEAGEVMTAEDPQVQVETPDPDDSSSGAEDSGDQPDADDAGDSSDAVDDGAPEPDGSTDAVDDGAPEPDGSTDATDTPADVVSPEAGDAEALLAAATTQLAGRSVRGEATLALPAEAGSPGALSARFEFDADGDLAVTVELPPGMDPEFPEGGDAEVRYVGGEQYIRPPTGTEAQGGPTWFIAEAGMAGQPGPEDQLGLLCVFPQMADAPAADCDPLAEAASLVSAASDAVVVGREEVRGVQTTRVGFRVSLLDLAGDALGAAPDSGDSEGFDSEGIAGAFEEMLSGLAMDVELWIDDDTLIRRMSLDLATLLMGFVGEEADMPQFLLTLEFYDFDADISVEAPPPESVTDDPSTLLSDGDSATTEPYDPRLPRKSLSPPEAVRVLSLVREAAARRACSPLGPLSEGARPWVGAAARSAEVAGGSKAGGDGHHASPPRTGDIVGLVHGVTGADLGRRLG